MDPRRSRDSPDLSKSIHPPLFPEEVLERILSMLQSHKDRSSAYLVSKSWYNAERWARRCLFIGNCYSVSPVIVARRFPNIRSEREAEVQRFQYGSAKLGGPCVSLAVDVRRLLSFPRVAEVDEDDCH